MYITIRSDVNSQHIFISIKCIIVPGSMKLVFNINITGVTDS